MISRQDKSVLYDVSVRYDISLQHSNVTFWPLCDFSALPMSLFGPANVTFWNCQCDFSSRRLFPASGTLPRDLQIYIELN